MSKDPASLHPFPIGPFKKTTATRILQQVVRAIISDKVNGTSKCSFVREGEDKQIFVKYTGGDEELRLGDPEEDYIPMPSSINLAHLLAEANFNHLHFTAATVDQYSSLAEFRFYGSMYGKYSVRTYEQFKAVIGRFHEQSSLLGFDALSSLQYGDMVSIFHYTHNAYREINQLLRGETSILYLPALPSLLLHAAIGAHALNKLKTPKILSTPDDPSSSEASFFRMINLPTEQVEEFKTKVGQQAVTQEPAFLSTSYEKDAFGWGEFRNVRLIYTNIHGLAINPLSASPSEKEYLIPPSTQVKWNKYECIIEKGMEVHCFTLEGVNFLLEEKKSHFSELAPSSPAISPAYPPASDVPAPSAPAPAAAAVSVADTPLATSASPFLASADLVVELDNSLFSEKFLQQFKPEAKDAKASRISDNRYSLENITLYFQNYARNFKAHDENKDNPSPNLLELLTLRKAIKKQFRASDKYPLPALDQCIILKILNATAFWCQQTRYSSSPPSHIASMRLVAFNLAPADLLSALKDNLPKAKKYSIFNSEERRAPITSCFYKAVEFNGSLAELIDALDPDQPTAFSFSSFYQAAIGGHELGGPAP